MSYANALKHPKWFEKREKVFKSRGKKCEVCGEVKQLHVHHKTYKIDDETNNFFAPWEYPISNFSVLCDKCHSQAHKYFKPAVIRTKKSKIQSTYNFMKDKFSKFFSEDAKELDNHIEVSDYDTGKSSLSNNLGTLFSIDDIDDPYMYGQNFSETHEGSEPIYYICLKKVKSIAERKSLNSQESTNSELILDRNKVKAELDEIKSTIYETEKKIQDKKEEIEKKNFELKDNEAKAFEAPTDKFYLRLYFYLMLVLTSFMFVFYSSAMFNAFFVDVDRFLIEDRSFGTIINLEALPYLFEQGLIQSIIGIISILTAFAIPVAFAVAIHRVFEDGKKFTLSLIVLATLFFDGLLAFLIEQNKYSGQYLRGLVDEPFTVTKAFVDIQFYLILMVGFGTFILLSALFHFYSQEKIKFDPLQKFQANKQNIFNKKKIEIETLNNEIKSYEQDLIRLEAKQSSLSDKYLNVQSKIIEKSIDLDYVQNFVLEFTIGYAAYISENFTKKKSKEKNQKLYEMINEFFEKEGLPTLRTNVLTES